MSVVHACIFTYCIVHDVPTFPLLYYLLSICFVLLIFCKTVVSETTVAFGIHEVCSKTNSLQDELL